MWPLTVEGAELFGLLLVRCLGFYMAGPLFTERGLPGQVKVLLAAGTAIALLPIVPFGPLPATDLPHFVLAVAGETFMGILLGFGAGLPFIGIRMAAELIGIQVGFGIVNVIDPREGERVSVLGRFYELAAIMVFLALNGHHLLLRALGTSIRVVPIGGVAPSPGLVGHLVGMAGSMFVTALAVGAPLIAVLFLTDAAMGFVARTVPQMNIFIVGFPVKIAIGLFGIAVTLPFFMRTIDRLIPAIERDLLLLLSGM
jgi:flagellar biosynthetic protein FliR